MVILGDTGIAKKEEACLASVAAAHSKNLTVRINQAKFATDFLSNCTPHLDKLDLFLRYNNCCSSLISLFLTFLFVL